MALTDDLAVQRTRLANERTWLAYIRTALTLFIAGVSFIQFFHLKLVHAIGWSFIPAGVLVALMGWRRYRHVRSMIRDRQT